MQFADKKFFNYQYEESRILSLMVMGAPLVANQRAYFGENSKLHRKRIVAISINAPEADNLVVDGVTTLRSTQLNLFTLTLVDESGNEVVKDFPLSDLNRVNTFGYTRVFNRKIDIEKSYVTYTLLGVSLGLNLGLFFNFYTVDEP